MHKFAVPKAFSLVFADEGICQNINEDIVPYILHTFQELLALRVENFHFSSFLG